MTDTSSPLDIAGIVGGALTILASIGAAMKWVFSRADTKEMRLQKREDEYVRKIEARLSSLESKTEILSTCVTLLASALHAENPFNPALVTARRLLGAAFPIDLATPPDMTDMLNRMDAAPATLTEYDV